jgi:YD repeat-containing protein
VAQFSETGQLIEVIGTNVNKTKVESGGTALEKNRCTAASGNVCQAGSAGGAEGQISEPIGIATTGGQNMFVVEKANNRVEKFNPQGELLAKFGSSGAEAGQLKEPTAIAYSPVGSGCLWVADTGNNRIEAWTLSYAYSRQSGKEGTANGQFKGPAALDVDAEGNVWVGDQGNSRVQELSATGAYLTQFGSAGWAAGRFSFSAPIGIALDAKGNVWVTDSGNNRVEKWVTPPPNIEKWEAEVAAEIEAPSVDVNVSSDLVQSVEGSEAGELTYVHSGESLTAVKGPEGESKYEYDGAGRMTKVTLPNGTYAEIAYEVTYGRVKTVTVSIEGGAPKTTHFEYTDSPSRSTRVVPEGPATVYDMAADGSFVRWQNVGKAPEIEDLGGNLVDPEHRETEKAMEPGAYELNVKAFSAEGIAKIEVIANGNIQVDEKTCAEDFEKPGVECEHVSDSWVTESANWAPGIVYLEVVVTDREGHKASERFWVNVPYTPPPDPEAEAPPTYTEIKDFREEFGLDLDLKGNEEAINERIFGLIRAWENPYTPAGEVARATRESFGVPLRQVDAAELEYRENYVNQAAAAIPQWVSMKSATSTYAGYYVDHRAGGILYVGFTTSQGERVADLKATGGLVAPGARVMPFPTQPTISIGYLESLQLEIVEVAGAPSAMGGAQVDIQHNRVDVGASNVAEVEGFLKSHFGAAAPINIYYEAVTERPSFARITSSQTGPMKAADMIGSTVPGAPTSFDEVCSAGWGAWDTAGVKPDGSKLYRHFLTTAGHCFEPGTEVKAMELDAEEKITWTRKLGYVRRYSFDKHPSNFATDAEAILLEDPSIVPRLIRRSSTKFTRIKGAAVAMEGMIVCRAGSISSHVQCGPEEWPPKCERWGEHFENHDPVLCTIRTEIPIKGGDSGGPFWERGTSKAVGTLTGGVGTEDESEGAAWFTPVLEIPGYPKAPGSLNALGTEGEPLHLVVWK